MIKCPGCGLSIIRATWQKHDPVYHRAYYLKHQKKWDKRSLRWRTNLNIALRKKATNHGSQWTLKELKYLEQNKGAVNHESMAQYLGRSLYGVRNQLHAMKIGKTQKKIGEIYA